ncbi:PSD1 and planctomycete cytochrome C domain-containing protein [Novipirellula artificiosorum]|uniref:Planctomycete cytochrome C n=1 Tax=Novipirellula artificiosorum TaxID=2528016 RepID=A0A5C6DP02_9BACT|nr:PSD1 and planctomycete cytochrome C domain-containing protein [Novipirellula artificiosorum]TWU38530.1 Planctomycete cytochrome C [Novipirellula artificiosorum]
MKRLIILLLLLASPVRADHVVPKTIRPASDRFAQRDARVVPDFQRHVVPLLGKLGCNSAKCHGSFQGQGDFRLSLFGFDFHSDHAALHADAYSEEGGRLHVGDSENSLILRKATEQTDHEGGQRFEIGSWQHHLLLRWIETGAKGAIVDGSQGDSHEDAENPGTPITEQSGDTLFRESIQPILEDHCYECHGFNSRKGNFSLNNRVSLLAGGDAGPAVVPGKPGESLLLTAVGYSDDELQMPPSGKLPEEKIEALKKWIELGAPWPDEYDFAPQATDQKLVALRCEPKEILFREPGQTQQLRIIAEWDDGTREDVTCLSRFHTNDDAIVRISTSGLATSTGEGDTHVIAFYDNGVAAIPMLRPNRGVGSPSTGEQAVISDAHPIDRFVNAKLEKLGLTPSEACTDAEFLRRVSIDLTGTLPTPGEVLAFLGDNSQDRRTRKIEELLGRPSYAAWWTNKLCDFTGCNPKSISSLLEVAREDGYVKASQWYEWILERVERNEPYDRIVAGLMLADLSGRGDSMPYFWTRQSLEEPKDTAMSVAHAFLGIQLQCAECHKHPFDQWTQADFNDFSLFFDSVTKTKRRSITDRELELGLLRSGQVRLSPGDDPRRPIMEWMQNPENPWFARAFVNRVWAGYFNRGIVDPPDQFTPANPPSHPQLLNWLAAGFVENGYDMKWLHRQITNSQTYQRSWKPGETNRNDLRNFSRTIPRRIPAEVVYDAMKQVAAAPAEQEEVRSNLRRRASGHLSMRMAGTHAMKVFGKPDRSINCDCERVNEPTLLQAIFTQNDPLLRMRLADSGWIIEIEDAEKTGESLDTSILIEQVWLRTVGRLPTEADRARATKHLSESPTLTEGVVDLLWAMMNSKEFLLNH